MKKIILGITGASGALYAKRFIDVMADQSELHVVCSKSSHLVFQEELDLSLGDFLKSHESVTVHKIGDYLSPLASGSNIFDAFIILPCSMKTLGQISHGVGDTLLTRIGDICLKERRQMIMVPRESPLSVVNLENMLRISQMGGIILPAAPGFYHKPEKIEDLIDFMIQRVCQLAGIKLKLVNSWKAEDE